METMSLESDTRCSVLNNLSEKDDQHVNLNNQMAFLFSQNFIAEEILKIEISNLLYIWT